ncbi:NlpC/P60 family protein [Paenibacillus glucanolyticus]|nr:NlpC/P60 family protein [Paenibacillus glucanolyticus]
MGASSSVLIVLLVIAMTAAVIASPFGLFVSGENTDPQVTSVEQIVHDLDAAFVARLEEIEREHGYVDRMEMHYPGSADNTRMDNWSDIMAVFAVKTTMDAADGMDVATLDATRTDLIEALFWEMNRMDSDIETVDHTETITVVHEDGSTSEESVTVTEYILHITVTSQTAEQQATVHGFTAEQKELMEEMLTGEFRPLMQALLGKEADTGLTLEQLEYVYHDLPAGELGSDAVRLALTRLGDPYSQPKAGQGNYTDCSYLVQWCYRQLGISLPRTAAEQARYCVENSLTISPDDLMPGDLVFWSYERNGRFMDITHVGIYAGEGKVVDASSSRGQVVYRGLFDADKQVLFGRPYLSEE